MLSLKIRTKGIKLDKKRRNNKKRQYLKKRSNLNKRRNSKKRIGKTIN